MSSAHDPELQELAAYAAQVLGIPVALVTQLGETRQTFLANVGFARDETTLDESFCAYAVQGEGLFEVPDATRDPRFARNPLVIGETGVRFYAGVPVASPDGVAHGALCVLDTRPRTLTDAQRRTLAFLARQAEGRLALLDRVRELEEERARATIADAETRRAEGALAQSEAHYRTLFASVDDGFCTYEMIFDEAGRPVDYRFLEVNDAFVAQTGLTREAAVGTTIRTLVPTHEQRWFDLYGRVALTGEPIRFEDHAEGLGRWYEVHAFRIGGEGSREVGAIFKDVSRRHEEEQALADERRRLDETLRTAGVATFDWDVPNDRLYGNDLLGLFYGFPDDPDGHPITRFFRNMHPDDGDARREAIDAAIVSGGNYEAQYRVTGSDGEERWVLARGEVELDPDRRPLRVTGVVLDVTERVLTERALDAERTRQDRTLENAEVATFDWDPVTDRVYANPLLAAFFGVSGADARGGPIATYLAAIHPDDREATGDAIAASLAAGGRYETQYRIVDAGGRERWVLARGDTTLDPLGNPLRLSGVVLDITDRIASERTMRGREELFRTVFEQAPDDAILVMDRDRTLTAWNPAAERITGWSAADMIGQRADLTFTPENVARGGPAEEAEGAARLDKVTDERWHMRKDGSRFWGSGTMNALHDADGNVTGFLKVFRDATARYEETRALAFLRRLTDAVVEVRDPDAIVATAERMLGEHLGAQRVSFGEISSDGATATVRQDWTNGLPSLVGSHRLADFDPRIFADLVAGRPYVSRDSERDYRLGAGLEAVRRIGSRASVTSPILKEGRFASYLAVHSLPPRDWTEDEVGLVKQVADRVTAEVERARAEAALRTSEEQLRAVFAQAPAVIAVLGGPGPRFQYVNEGYRQLTGFRPMLGLTMREALPEATGGGEGRDYDRIIESVCETGVPLTFQARPVYVQRMPGGEPEDRFMDLAYLALRGADGAITGVLVHGIDVTDQVLARQAMAASNEELERRVEARTSELAGAVEQAEGFNYSISHDLRTPLRAMVSTSSILLEDLGPELDEEHRELLERQAYNANRMGRLIDELLRLSRFARVPVNRQTLDMTDKARRIWADLEEQGRTNGCRLDAQPGMTAQGDAELVRTVLHNLIGNACKFSPNGGTVHMRQEGDVFSLSDEGVGFEMAHAVRMFLPFERLVLDSEFEGTGIGLANVKRIVERHGGRVWSESIPGQGATFFFTLG